MSSNVISQYVALLSDLFDNNKSNANGEKNLQIHISINKHNSIMAMGERATN